MDLHPEEAALSGAEDEEQEHSDQDLQIRRTVTQVGRQLLKPFYICFSFLLVPKQSQTGGNSLNFQMIVQFLSSLKSDVAVL